jgi:hypothetical protein
MNSFIEFAKEEDAVEELAGGIDWYNEGRD